jgi:peptidoglycan/LPS O-acetylase OafA/YrhL
MKESVIQQPQRATRPPGRIVSLDSLRGIAAFLVVLRHCIHMQDISGRPGLALARMAELIGKDAVLIFFVLSGFVLFLSFRGIDRLHYGPYLIKRFCRIYLPFAAAILISAGLYLLVQPAPLPGLSRWFNEQTWAEAPTFGLVAGHLAMTDHGPWQSLDVVMWSLVHELRISVIFPLIAFGILRGWRTTLAVAFLLSFAGLALYRHVGGDVINLLSSARYLWLFAVGALMAHKRDALRAWMSERSVIVRASFWIWTLIVMAIPFEAVENLTTPVASVAIVLLCFADRPVDDWLSRPVPEWLGRISYSLYLIHVPVLLTLTHLLYGRVPMAALLALIVATSLLLAHIMYAVVERPSMRLGRILAKKV